MEADELLDAAYPKLRAEADAWQAARTAFMMRRLQEGRHPDTDPRFWDGYAEAPAPGLPTQTEPGTYGAARSWAMANGKLALFLGISLPLVAAWMAYKGAKIWRTRRKAAQLPRVGFSESPRC